MNKLSPVLRKATNLSLDVALVEEAKALGISISRACEAGLAAELGERRKAQWLEENAAAIEASNDYVRKHGLPLAKFRQF